MPRFRYFAIYATGIFHFSYFDIAAAMPLLYFFSLMILIRQPLFSLRFMPYLLLSILLHYLHFRMRCFAIYAAILLLALRHAR